MAKVQRGLNPLLFLRSKAVQVSALEADSKRQFEQVLTPSLRLGHCLQVGEIAQRRKHVDGDLPHIN